MKGIEKITQLIQAEAQSEIDSVLANARQEADTVASRYQVRAEAEAAELAAKNEKAAAELAGLALVELCLELFVGEVLSFVIHIYLLMRSAL